MRFGSKLISKLGYLAKGIASSDYRPTDQHFEVQRPFASELRTHLAALGELIATEVAAFSELLRRSVPNVVVNVREERRR